MTLLNRIENSIKLWEVMLPHITPPSPDWFGRWNAGPDKYVEHAIIRASKKFTPAKVDDTLEPEIVWRYVGGVIANEARQHAERKGA